MTMLFIPTTWRRNPMNMVEIIELARVLLMTFQ